MRLFSNVKKSIITNNINLCTYAEKYAKLIAIKLNYETIIDNTDHYVRRLVTRVYPKDIK